MWTYEHTLDTPVSPHAIWSALADVAHWPVWDASLEKIDIDGPFAEGTTFTMTPAGQDEVQTTLTEIRHGEYFADQTHFAGVVLEFTHHLEPLPDGGTRLTHGLRITGPTADAVGPEIGPMIVEDLPDAMAALVAHAAS